MLFPRFLMIFPSFIKMRQNVIFSWFLAKSILFYINQHEKCSFYDFWWFFPVSSRWGKISCSPDFQQNRSHLSEWACKNAFLRFLIIFLSYIKKTKKHTFTMISDDFFQCHKKKQNDIFFWFPAKSIWFCLNQQENMLFPRFLMIFSRVIKRSKMSFSPDFQQNQSVFVWISMKKYFYYDFWWFFLVSSKEAKNHFLLIYSKIDLILSESAWKNSLFTISDYFSQLYKKDKMSFSPDFQQNRSLYVWISM